MVIDLGHSDLGVSLPQRRHQLRGRERPATQREKVGPPRSGASSASPPGGGQGSASRSTFPEVRVGSSSTRTSRGTSAAGRLSASLVRAAATSNAGSVLAM
jgi:hypothetical protein